MPMRSTGYLPNDWGIKNELIELTRLGRCFLFGVYQIGATSDYSQIALANTRTDGQPLIVYSALLSSNSGANYIQLLGFPSIQILSTTVPIGNARLDGKASGATASTQAGAAVITANSVNLFSWQSNQFPTETVAPGVIIVPVGWSLLWQWVAGTPALLIGARWIEPVAELPIHDG